MEDDKAGPTGLETRVQVLDILEQQLPQLDAVGARKAAAHLDAAIEQLRRELVNDAWDAASREPVPTETEQLASHPQSAEKGPGDAAKPVAGTSLHKHPDQHANPGDQTT